MKKMLTLLVAALAFNAQAAEKLSVYATAVPNAEILELDVTIPSTIQQCKDIVSKRTGDKLDVLVNNAGIDLQSPLLEVDIQEARKVYDVNFWGTLAVTQAFAPLLIEAKGVIANQSTIDAAMSMVWAGKSPRVTFSDRSMAD